MTQVHPDDRPPDGGEAQAQRQQTVTPWLWGLAALVVVAAFVFFAVAGGPPTLPAGHGAVGPTATAGHTAPLAP